MVKNYCINPYCKMSQCPRSNLLLSLCLILGLTVSLGEGQTLVRIGDARQSGDLTGQTLPFTDVGSGVTSPWTCDTTGGNTNVVWQFPDGTNLQQRPAIIAVNDEFYYSPLPDGRVILYCGPNRLSPVGEYCCVRTGTDQRLCVTFTPGSCPVLMIPTNGNVTYTFPNSPMDTNAVATYTCDPGNVREGNEQRTCQSGGTWTGGVSTCRFVDCGPLTNPANGQVIVSTTTYQSSATYSCNSGYMPNEDVTRTCGADGDWTLDAPTCDPVVCDALTDPANGKVMTPDGTTGTFMNNATYSCNIGYRLFGSISRTCGSNGQWSSTPPTCTVNCPGLSSPGNVQIVYSSPTTPRPVGLTATYSCVPGYDLIGTAVRMCTSTGWSDDSTPTCTPVMCDALTDPPNGKVTNPAQTTFMNTATYSCNTGYILNGDMTRTCGTTRAWSGVAPTCEPVMCDALTDPPNGQVMTPDGTTFMNTATYSCNSGYEINGDMTRTCGDDGNWTLTAPTCTALCPRESPLNGMTSYSVQTDPPPVGTIATYSCDNGYELSGDKMRTCVDNTGWSGSLPTCNPVDCGPLSITNGQVMTPDGTTFMNTASYSCNSGYEINGDMTRTCGADRNWSPADPTCDPVDCGPLSVTNGRVIFSGGTTYLNNATYSCNFGYTLNGTSTRFCAANRMWSLMSSSEPTCDPVDCGPLNITNGQVMTPDGTTFMNIATYSCDMGYNLTGSVVRMCGADRMWTLEEPACDFIPLTVGNAIFNNNSVISVSAIGEDESSLRCHTELTTCCRDEDNVNGSRLGDWFGPDGNTIPETSTDGFYVTREQGAIALNLRQGTSAPTGVYCCVLPTSSGNDDTFCVEITNIESTPLPLGPVVGGVLGAIIVFILIIVVVIIVLVVLRRTRQKDYQPSSKLEQPYSTTYAKKKNVEDTATIQKNTKPSIIDFPSDIRATEGEEVYVRVKVGGHPPPSITWYHNGIEVTADYATELGDDGGITFPCIETKHDGVYKLVVSGPSGAKDEKQLSLSVGGEGVDTGDDGLDYSPVSVAQFGAFVADFHANGNRKFKDYYKELDTGESGHSITVSKQHKDGNRFANISVYDDNLIVLQPLSGQEDCQSDYINASYVDGYNSPKQFLATQGPLPRTLVDFWRLMWQERPTTIVMLTNLKEGNKIKCEEYWPESGSKTFGPFTVTITDQQVLANYTVRNLKVSLAGDRRGLKITQFHFTTWPDHGVPDYATPILAFHRRVKSHHNPSKGPLLIHCSAGVGRTGTYIAIDNVLDQIAAEGMVDISGVIVRSRNQRMKLVQTQDQYVFIHDAILESVTCGDTQISAGDLRREIQKMSQISSGKTITGFQDQFKVLEQVSPNPSEVKSATAVKHRDKNRGNKYLPSETNRVVLSGEQPDYIHAVYAHGYKHRKAYIIAQNPLPSTIRNFWKVIYDRKCAAVVMLTPLKEEKQEVCSQYWPESGTVQFGEFTIDNLGEEAFPGFTIRSLSVLNETTQKAHQVTQFHVMNWTRDGNCANLKTVTDVNEEVTKVQRRTGNRSIVVHCTDTVTRSGMYCAIATTIDRCKTEGVVDVFQVVKALRVHKPGAVLSVENYQALFDAILVYLDSFDTYANFQ